MIFLIGQAQKKSLEQIFDLYTIFVDVSKAFDLVNGMFVVIHQFQNDTLNTLWLWGN